MAAGATLLAGAIPTPTPERIQDPSWVDPGFGKKGWQTTECRTLGRALPVRAVAWFDQQLLGDGQAYARRTEAWADAPRLELRKRVIRKLKAMNAESYAAIKPALARLEKQGKVRDCRPHWIVNSFSCEVAGLEPVALSKLPGVSKVFRRAAPCPVGKESGPADVSSVPEAAPLKPRRQPATWNLERLRIPKVWDRLGYTGKGVLVAIHDAGFRLDTPTTAPTLYRNPGEVPGNGVDDDKNGYVDDYHGYAFDRGDAKINTPLPTKAPSIHGNSVATIIAGRRVVDGTKHIYGGAPDARWAGICANGTIEEALEWSLEQGVDIYSMSFSRKDLGDYRAHWRKLMENGALAGIFFVSGAGNNGREGGEDFVPVPLQMRVPEDIPLAVFGVSGIGADGMRPPFSSQGPVDWTVEHYREGSARKPDLATVNQAIPGVDPEGRPMRRSINGNSFAGPHLAAVLALMLDADPDLTPWAARKILIETAIDIGKPGFDYAFGFGLVDAYAAVKAVEKAREARPDERPRDRKGGKGGKGGKAKPGKNKNGKRNRRRAPQRR